MLNSAFQLFTLRQLPWSRFNFPRWQALSGLALSGVLGGFDPSLRAEFPDRADMPSMSLGIAVAFSVLYTLVCTPIIVGFLRWWMQRDGRWDGQGEMFNLLVTSWLVAGMPLTGLIAVGIPTLLVLPLWLYSIWVGANALSGAIPKASLSYSMAGTVASLIPTMAVYFLAMGLMGFALGVLGVTFPPPV